MNADIAKKIARGSGAVLVEIFIRSNFNDATAKIKLTELSELLVDCSRCREHDAETTYDPFVKRQAYHDSDFLCDLADELESAAFHVCS